MAVTKFLVSALATVAVIGSAEAKPKVRGAVNKEIDMTKCTEAAPCNFLMIADLDSGNRVDGKKNKIHFESSLHAGSLARDSEGKFKFSFDTKPEKKITTKYNEGGRGGELSELTTWNGKLFTADDRTGIVYEIESEKKKLLPRFIFNEGDGTKSAKGFKIEWMAEKGPFMYLGSHGNPRPDDEGKMGDNLKWVMLAKKGGRMIRENWTEVYKRIEGFFDVKEGGYVTHEAIEWSDVRKQWLILPRRISIDTVYSEAADADKGTNRFLFCDEGFMKCEKGAVTGMETGNLKGFSSFKFVPGTNDTIVAALRTVEDNEKNLQESYVSVFDDKGNLLVEETQVPNVKKLEGFAFV